MMVHIGWLILACMATAMAILLLGGMCRVSGDASRCEECGWARIVGLQRRIAELEHELEKLLAAGRDAAADLRATDVFATPPDEPEVPE